MLSFLQYVLCMSFRQGTFSGERRRRMATDVSTTAKTTLKRAARKPAA
jgi:hypothetical protein